MPDWPHRLAEFVASPHRNPRDQTYLLRHEAAEVLVDRARVGELEAALISEKQRIEVEAQRRIDRLHHEAEGFAEQIGRDGARIHDLEQALRFLLDQVDDVARTSVIRSSDIYRHARAVADGVASPRSIE